MNIRFFVILLLTIMCLSTSACGLKRALTLPKDKEQDAKIKSSDEAEASSSDLTNNMSSEQPIDVLKPQH